MNSFQTRHMRFRLWVHSWTAGLVDSNEEEINEEDFKPYWIQWLDYWDAHAIMEGIPMDMGDEWTECCYVMQSTELYDLNGKEIYEGDLIRFLGLWDDKGNPIDDPEQLKTLYRIEWVMGGFHAIPVDLKYAVRADFSSFWKGVGHTDSVVVGNVCENPEMVPELKLE